MQQADGRSKDRRERADRFRAFVSYAHVDAAHARWLQTRLENYRLPSRIAGAMSSVDREDRWTGRVGPVFRDREDLSASSDLSQAVREALADSRTLVVVCTPATPGSQWVAREIELVRELHPDRPILAALFDGEPSTAFPAALTAGGVEPLAPDFRPEGDGPKLAFLKVVAGIVGIPLDELIQRDAQRRLRRVTAVTVASAALALVLLAMTAFALDSRRDALAAQQRAEGQARNTEDLNRYLVRDFRQELLALGRLDVAMEFYPKVLDYCRKQARVAGADASNRDCSDVMQVMGSDHAAKGEFDEARRYFAAANRATGARRAEDPRNPQRTLDHAISTNRLGLLSVAQEHPARALAEYRKALALLGEVETWGKTRPEWLRQAAYTEANVGSAMLESGAAVDVALRHLQRAVAHNEALIERAPGDQTATYDLVFHLMWLADARWRVGDDAAADKAAERYLAAIDEIIAAEPGNMHHREQQMQVYARHAELLQREGRCADAAAIRARALEVARMLAARDPSNNDWSIYRARLESRANEGECP